MIGAALLILAAGCRLSPDYQRPEMEVPENWKWKLAEPKDHLPRGPWWQMFQDPVLAQLQEQAAAGNFDLQAAVARVEQARATARVSRSEFYPALQGGAAYVRYRTSGNAPSPVPFPVPSFTQQQWTVPFDLTYEIDLWGRVRRSFEARQQLAIGADAARESILLTLQADVAATYFAVRSAEREMALYEEAIELRGLALDLFDRRLQAGIGNELEVQRARVELASSEADLQNALRRRAELVNALAVLCGKAPAVFDLPAVEGEFVLPDVAPDLPSELLERRPDVAQAERELAARLAEIGVAKAAFFPSVRLTASGGMLSGELADLFKWDSRTWSLGPSVSVPIFEGGRNRAQLERARAAYDEGVALYQQRVLVAFREVEDSLAALHYLRTEVEARRVAAGAATQAARLALDRYRAGVVNFLSVIDSENSRLLNELNRVRVINEQQIATVRLIKALGGGWE
jgi:outer membrane protein, multidrug efflux system